MMPTSTNRNTKSRIGERLCEDAGLDPNLNYQDTEQYKANVAKNGQDKKPVRPRVSKKYNDRPRGYTGLKKTNLDPTKRHSRLGVPDGMKRPQVEALWDAARSNAKEFIKMMEDGGVLPRDEVLIPDSDEGMAKAALKELCIIALGPIDTRTKVQAIGTLLNFTKEKPVTKVESNLSANDWLMEAVKAAKEAKDAVIASNRGTV
jgi:hypothetical protein